MKECVQSQQMGLFRGLMNGDIMTEKIVLDEDFTEKLSDWDESDVGKRICKRVTPNAFNAESVSSCELWLATRFIAKVTMLLLAACTVLFMVSGLLNLPVPVNRREGKV